MKYSFEIIFHKPDGRQDIFVFYAKKESMDLLMELYSTLKRMEEHELSSDVSRREGPYILMLKGPRLSIEFEQRVNDFISYEQMLYSLISTMVFDTVEKIYQFQKGENK
jgi:hypothetical protein